MTTTRTVLINAIKIGPRRRTDMGDIDELAESIKTHGLFHFPVVDDKLNLVAGGRRLQACQRLGWASIEVRMLGDLTESERREIELEENLRRKDLTQEERSKNLVTLAETAAKVLREEAKGFLPDSGKNPKGGRPSKPDAERKVSERIGVPQQTINLARQHVAAVERFPELAPITQADAIVVAKKLDAMPEPKRDETREAIKRHEPGLMAALTDRPPLPQTPTPHELAANDPGRKFTKGFHDLVVYFNGVRDIGGIQTLIPRLAPEIKIELLESVNRVIYLATEWRSALEGDLENEPHHDEGSLPGGDARRGVGDGRSTQAAA